MTKPKHCIVCGKILRGRKHSTTGRCSGCIHDYWAKTKSNKDNNHAILSNVYKSI